MSKVYTIAYGLNGKRKTKDVKLPLDANFVKCNKNPKDYGKGYRVKVKYELHEKKKERFFAVPSNAKNIKISQSTLAKPSFFKKKNKNGRC